MSAAEPMPPVADAGGHLLRPDMAKLYPIFVAGEGVELIDDGGRRYLDAAAGVGVTCLGYSADEVAEAVARQARTLQYVHALRFETPPMRQLADMIVADAPGNLGAVFFVSGGSEATESAIKFVRQYWLERGQPERWRIIGRRPSFHGNTLATLSVGWHAGRRRRHAPLLLDFPHVETPNTYRGCVHCQNAGGVCTLACADELERVIVEHRPETVAAFIAEPVVGAAGGALVPPPGYFARIRDICTAYDVLFIADEVITGFGRTGHWFGIEHFDVQPDIVVFAKGVSGGYAPLGGIIVRGSLLDAFRHGSGRFEHNFTMAGHPVACAAGVATLTVLQRDRLVERVADLEDHFFAELRRHLEPVPIVGDIRGLGLLAGVELVADRATKAPFAPASAVAARATAKAMEEGLVVYPCSGGVTVNSSASEAAVDGGDYLLLMPAFISTPAQLTEMAVRLGRALYILSRELLDP